MTNKEFEQLNQDDFLSLESSAISSFFSFNCNNFRRTHLKYTQLIELMNRKLNLGDRANPDLFVKGLNCEVLKFGSKGWKKGKVRFKVKISMEFCPDEAEIEETPATEEIPQPGSPLDDLRQLINKETQQ